MVTRETLYDTIVARDVSFDTYMAEYAAHEPDIQIVLECSYDRLQPTYMDGPAAIAKTVKAMLDS